MTPVLELSGIQKSYQSLRPLRLQALAIAPGERVAIAGLDAGGAEVLVNLVTGASLPDHGVVRVLGRATSEITDGDAWLASLDRFGIVSPRGVLLDSASIAQNIALVFTLEIDPVPDEVARARRRARERVRDRSSWTRRRPRRARRFARACTWRARWRSSRRCSWWSIRRWGSRTAPARRWRAIWRPCRTAAARRRSIITQDESFAAASAPPRPPARARDGRAEAGRARMVPMTPLLGEHAAGDARAAADARLRLAGDPLVLVAVNDDGRAVGVEDRERTGRDRDPRRHRS